MVAVILFKTSSLMFTWTYKKRIISGSWCQALWTQLFTSTSTDPATWALSMYWCVSELILRETIKGLLHASLEMIYFYLLATYCSILSFPRLVFLISFFPYFQRPYIYYFWTIFHFLALLRVRILNFTMYFCLPSSSILS